MRGVVTKKSLYRMCIEWKLLGRTDRERMCIKSKMVPSLYVEELSIFACISISGLIYRLPRFLYLTY